MAALGFALFDTTLGSCSIAWSARGIVGIGLPDANGARARARMRRSFPDALETAPPPEAQGAIDGIVALLRGQRADLSGIALDMERVPDFERRVYEAARAIPPGKTLTYGEIAARLGDPSLARDVGRALARNPFSIVVPCHRVLAAGGKIGGFSARGGVATKLRMLGIEGVQMEGTLPLLEGAQDRE